MDSLLSNIWILIRNLPVHFVQYGGSFLESHGVHTQNISYATLSNASMIATHLAATSSFALLPLTDPGVIGNLACLRSEKRVELEESIATLISLDSLGLRYFFPVDPSTSATRDAVCAVPYHYYHPDPTAFVDMSTEYNGWAPTSVVSDPEDAVLKNATPPPASSDAGHDDDDGEGAVKGEKCVYAGGVNVQDVGGDGKDSEAQTQAHDRPHPRSFLAYNCASMTM
ncbi:hypothetical protein C8R46DRAFT_1351431 [Mycena filopes]|nr:hypothetical protein C8R46DRAFT_1351431 [Mycena filopes]